MNFNKFLYYLKNPKLIRSKCCTLVIQKKYAQLTICKAGSILKRFYRKTKKVSIGIFLTGGLGDYIIESRVIDEITQMCDCMVDLYCMNIEYAEAIFGQRLNIYKYTSICAISVKYDVFLCLDHWIYVWYLDKKNLLRKNRFFAKQMEKINYYTKQEKTKIKQQCYREAIHFQRCEKFGIDRWTEQRCGDVFSIPNHKTYIPIYENFHVRVGELGLAHTQYITINRGADSMGRSGTQTKVWAKEYYERFVKLFKKQFPHIKIVQLGVSGNEKVRGVDVYAFDEQIESVKWILHDSLLHIDCEGGLVHLATQFETTCIVLFGPTPLHMYGYEQNINLQAGNCHNCMGLHENWAFECLRGMEQPECMYRITPEIVFAAAKDYLKGNKQNEKNTR